MKKTKKMMAVLTATTMALTMMVPMEMSVRGLPKIAGINVVKAAEEKTTKNTKSVEGKCGDNVKYTYDENTKTLTINGKGEMWDDSGLSNGLEAVENIIIEEGVTSIGEYSFEKVTEVKTLTIPNSVTTIKRGAFNKISGTVVLPATIKKVESEAFNNVKKYVIKGNAVGFEKGSLGDKVIEVEISGNAAELGFALMDQGAVSVKIASDNNSCKISNGCIVSTDGKMLYYCITSKNDITIPDTVETIVPGAMYGHYANKVTLGENVKTIGDYAFEKSGVDELITNKKLASVGVHAFAGCQLSEVTFYGKVKLDVGAFDSFVKIINAKKFKYNQVAIKSAKLKGKKMRTSFTAISGAKGYRVKVKRGKKTYTYLTKKNYFTKKLPKKIYSSYVAKKSYEVDSNTKTTLTKAAYVMVRPYKLVKKNKKSYGTWSAKVVLSK